MRSRLLLLAACLVLGSGALDARAQEPSARSESAATPTPAPASETATATAPATAAATGKVMHAATAPPAELQKIDLMKGAWNSKVTIHDADPPRTATGKAKFAWAFQGMHLEGDHTYTVGGKPMKGRTTWGWDPEKKQYQLLWVSSFGPAGKTYYGTFPSENTLAFFTTFLMDGKAVTEKVTFSFVEKNSYTFLVENDLSGTMTKVLEETGTRVVSSAKTTPKSSSGKSTAKTAKPATTSKKSG